MVNMVCDEKPTFLAQCYRYIIDLNPSGWLRFHHLSASSLRSSINPGQPYCRVKSDDRHTTP
jgi:hypothetical protein